MLAELKIKNFAIIEELSLEFREGFTVITGETGAGKSMIIDALNILVGQRSSVNFIRHGATRAEIQGVFSFSNIDHLALIKARELGIDTEDNELIFRRVVSKNGKNQCYLNNTIVKVSDLKEVGLKVLDIHGQHEHQELMDDAMHVNLLDSFAGDNFNHILDEYQELFFLHKKTAKELEKMVLAQAEYLQQMDLFRFQIDEINEADFYPTEEGELEKEKLNLLNFEKINKNLQTTYNYLSGESGGMNSILTALNCLNNISDYGDEYEKLKVSCGDAYYTLEDIRDDVISLLDNFDFDEERLFEIEERLSLLRQMKRKYGETIEEILHFKDKTEEKLKSYENKGQEKEKLTKLVEKYEKKLLPFVKELERGRHQAGEELEKVIQKELQHLYMEKAQFKVIFTKQTELSYLGSEKVEFFITTNPGEPIKPISKIASGGELSRIMLAIKTIFTNHQTERLVIFDEIDTGVSGRVAQAIAEKIYDLTENNQIFAITHLPHVAAMADNHLLIAKEQEETVTRTTVTLLEPKERIKEIGFMISGKNTTAHTKEHVRTMLEHATNIKNYARNKNKKK